MYRPWQNLINKILQLKPDKQTLARDTRALGNNSQWYVASFAIAVTTKHRSLDCDDFLKVAPSELRADSCLKPRRLPRQIEEIKISM